LELQERASDRQSELDAVKAQMAVIANEKKFKKKE
jgi:hypothetical protein